MTTTTCFIEPLDVLFLRGNKLFDDPGSYGESLVPPWPSVIAGALRSHILAQDGIDLVAFAAGAVEHSTLGTPAKPGPFTVTAFQLARRFADGRVERVMAPPADLVISEQDGQPGVRGLQPTPLASGLAASSTLPRLPVLAEDERGKPTGGYWLTQAGWQHYLAGQTPRAEDWLKSSQLWSIDHRVGVGLDATARRAADGQLFSVQAVAMRKAEHQDGQSEGFDVGFLVSIAGAGLPRSGVIRLGGDGRGAVLHEAETTEPQADFAALAQARRCRIVLTSPGLFTEGWLPNGIIRLDDGNFRFDRHGVTGKLVCAAVPRSEVVSGWDLARWQPKPAQRVAPTGSVYWLDELDATPEALGHLVERGLWGDSCEEASRRAEGFNRLCLAAWSEGEAA